MHAILLSNDNERNWVRDATKSLFNSKNYFIKCNKGYVLIAIKLLCAPQLGEIHFMYVLLKTRTFVERPPNSSPSIKRFVARPYLNSKSSYYGAVFYTLKVQHSIFVFFFPFFIRKVTVKLILSGDFRRENTLIIPTCQKYCCWISGKGSQI